MAARIVKKRRPRLKLAVVDKNTLKKRADALFSFIYENVTILTDSHKEAASGLFFFFSRHSPFLQQWHHMWPDLNSQHKHCNNQGRLLIRRALLQPVV